MCVLGAACGSSSKPASPTTTTTPSSTTVVTTIPQTTVPGTGVTTPLTTPTTIATTIKESAYVVSVDPTARTITIDPMEFLVGAAATTEYHKENPQAPPGGPPDDYLIVNPTKDKVVLPLDPSFDVELVHIGDTLHNPPVSASLTQLSHESNLQYRPFWVTVERGVATRAEEQFIP